MKILKKYYY